DRLKASEVKIRTAAKKDIFVRNMGIESTLKLLCANEHRPEKRMDYNQAIPTGCGGLRCSAIVVASRCRPVSRYAANVERCWWDMSSKPTAWNITCTCWEFFGLSIRFCMALAGRYCSFSPTRFSAP